MTLYAFNNMLIYYMLKVHVLVRYKVQLLKCDS